MTWAVGLVRQVPVEQCTRVLAASPESWKVPMLSEAPRHPGRW